MTRDTSDDFLEDDLKRVFDREKERDQALFLRLARPKTARRQAGSWMAWAACLVTMVSLLVLSGPKQESLMYEIVCGLPNVEGQEPGRLVKGRWLETDGATRVRLSMGDLGFVDVESGSRICLRAANDTQQRLELAEGRISAVVTAPPRLFLVDTPAVRAVDLGCAYTLEVGADQSSLLNVTAGWVAFDDAGFEVVVPAGAFCLCRKGQAPEVPYFSDATMEFVELISRLDGARGGVSDLIPLARPKDSLSLFYLLRKVPVSDRWLLIGEFKKVVGESHIDWGALAELRMETLLALKELLIPLWEDRWSEKMEFK